MLLLDLLREYRPEYRCYCSAQLQYAPKVLTGVNVIIASPLGITAPCSFFLCVGLYLCMLQTKFHTPQTKTFCLRGDTVDLTKEQKSLDLLSRAPAIPPSQGSSHPSFPGLQPSLLSRTPAIPLSQGSSHSSFPGLQPSLLPRAPAIPPSQGSTISPSQGSSHFSFPGLQTSLLIPPLPFQGQNRINKRFINLFLMDPSGLLAHTVYA